jgi:hypothetical protein
MSREGFVAVLVGGALLFVTLAHAQPVVAPANYKTSGNVVAADLLFRGLESYAYASIAPIELNGRQAYLVSWSWVRYVPGFRIQEVRGIAPATAVNARGPNRITVDLDLNLLTSVEFATERDCTSGTCVDRRPVSVPFRGYFEPYTGVLSSYSQGNGNRRSVKADRYATTIWTRTGEEVSQSANFTGIVGELTVTPYGSDSNAVIYRASGSGTLQVLPTPPQ